MYLFYPIKTDIKLPNNRPDLFVYDKKKGEITLIEVGITNQDLLQTVETEKHRKYDVLANELGLIYKVKVKIIPIVMTWEGIVTIYHKKYLKELGITKNIQAYMQSRTLKKTFESINLDFRRGTYENLQPDGELKCEVLSEGTVVSIVSA